VKTVRKREKYLVERALQFFSKSPGRAKSCVQDIG